MATPRCALPLVPVRKSEKLKKPSLSEQLAGTAGSITSYTGAGSITSYTGAGSITSFAGAGSITSSLDLEVTMDDVVLAAGLDRGDGSSVRRGVHRV